MGRRSVVILLGALVLAGLAGSSGAALIHVTTDITGNVTQIEQNQTVTVNIRALVENPLSPNDGIFTFDQDLILANLLNNQPSIVAVQSVTRPNVSDNLFAGSDGSANSTGLSAIYGGYFPDTLGIGTPALLFSVVLKGIDVGTESITPGPSITPYGFDFVLYQSSKTDTNVTYDGGVRLDVVAGPGGPGGGGGGNPVPLPPALGCGVLAALIMPAMRRRFARRA